MTTANGTEPQGGASLFWLAYGQIAAMLGALSLLVFLGHFLDVGLNGVIRNGVEWWVQNVRPLVGLPFQWAIDQLPEAWRFKLPPVAADYLGVGIVSLLSALRMLVTFNDTKSFVADGPWNVVFLTLILVFAWPLVVLISLGNLVFDKDVQVARVAMWNAPLIYLGLLFAANAWLV